MIYPSVNRIFESARKFHGYTQSDMASDLNHSTPQFISNCERNIASIPMSEWAWICDAYEIDLEDVKTAALFDTRVHLDTFVVI